MKNKVKPKAKVEWDPNPLANSQEGNPTSTQHMQTAMDESVDLTRPIHKEFGKRVVALEEDEIEVYPPGVDTRDV